MLAFCVRVKTLHILARKNCGLVSKSFFFLFFCPDRCLHFYWQSQLRSLSSGLAAHGGSVMDAGKGAGWSGWREEGGSLSPEGTQASYEYVPLWFEYS